MTCVLCLSELIQLLAFSSKNMSQTTLCGQMRRYSQTLSSCRRETPCSCADKHCSSNCSNMHHHTPPSHVQMIWSRCSMMNWNKSSLCVLLDRAFVTKVLLTSTRHLPLNHGLVTLDGQRGVNPLLFQTPATVKSGVRRNPVCRENVHYPPVLRGCMSKLLHWLIVSITVEIERFNEFNLRHLGGLVNIHSITAISLIQTHVSLLNRWSNRGNNKVCVKIF